MASSSSQATMSTSSTPLPSATTTSYDEQSMNSIFAINGSPAVIAAFLGIGLFTVIMTVLFACRRANRTRLIVQPLRPASRPTKKPIVLGEKPMLCDLWTRTEEGEMVDTRRWENIMPLSATVCCPIERERIYPSATTKVIESRTPNRFRPIMSAIGQYLRPHPSVPIPVPPESSAYELEDMNVDAESRGFLLMEKEHSSVTISFTIAMPLPRRHDDAVRTIEPETNNQGLTPEPVELGEYCIGSIEVPCGVKR